jgi:DNA recombination-dependent growth factor C
LDGNGLLGELLNQVLIRTELLGHLLRKDRLLSRVFTSTLTNWSQVFPVDRVVDVASEVELDSLAESGNTVVVKVGFGL